MLQQTRAETVTRYYERWLERFPTIEALARADPDDVLRVWQGLGYYSRARNLHRAARIVSENHAGRLPATARELMALPGLGPYTAGAIASIAFDQPEPAVDGNATRLFSRLLDRPDLTVAELARILRPIVPAKRPGDFNQAVMELGSNLCRPRNPRCDECPLRRLCLARQRGMQHRRPRRRRPAELPVFHFGTAVVTDPQQRFLLHRRPDRGLLAGMWAFPAEPLRENENAQSAARRAVRRFRVPLPRARGAFIATIPHDFSHRREIYHVHRFMTTGPTPNGVWLTARELEQLAMPAAQRRILQIVLDGAAQNAS